MITDEKYMAIRDLVMKEFRKSGALNETDNMQQQVNCIVGAFPEIYQRLQSQSLLPEGMDYNIFQQVIIPRLQEAAHKAQISRMFIH